MLNKKSLWKLNVAFHRDLGYFATSLIVVYCLSGIALNHINDWNPDFLIEKQTVTIGKTYSKNEITNTTIEELSRLVGESTYKVYDFPTNDQIKIYYDNSSLHINLISRIGIYEKVSRRPVFYQTNVLHRNSLRGWKWVSDIFALILIIINTTGLFILKGKYGLSGRGKWLILAGILPPFIGLLIFEFV